MEEKLIRGRALRLSTSVGVSSDSLYDFIALLTVLQSRTAMKQIG